MQNQQIDLKSQERFRLLRQPAAVHREEAESATMPAVQRDATAQLSCRLGDDSCAGAHAETLDSPAVQTAPDAMLRLQRAYGNRFVQRVVDISRQGEGEADVTSEVEQQIQSARGGGQALDSSVRAQMEPAFGANFGGVRVHSDSGADSLNRSLSARAFTTGQDIFFKQGEYNPGTSGGRELLAHELTHVVQQNGDQVQAKLTVGAPGDRYEQEADSVARAVMQLERQPVQNDDARQVQRQALLEEEEEEEPIQARSDTLQWQPEAVQRQVEEEQEEPLQAKTNDLQRQIEGEEENQTDIESGSTQVQNEEQEGLGERVQTNHADLGRLFRRESDTQVTHRHRVPQIQSNPISAAGLGLAVFSTAVGYSSSGGLSHKSNNVSYMHPNTPKNAKWKKALTQVHIKAFHPRLGWGTQHFYFRLEYEYNGHDIRNASVQVLRDKSSGMYSSSFDINWVGTKYSRPKNPVSQVSFNISGRWDPHGRGDVSFWGKLIISAGFTGRFIERFTIGSEKNWVWKG